MRFEFRAAWPMSCPAPSNVIGIWWLKSATMKRTGCEETDMQQLSKGGWNRSDAYQVPRSNLPQFSCVVFALPMGKGPRPDQST